MILIISILAILVVLAGCTVSADRPVPEQVWPDASTPVGHDEINGGIMNDALIVDGVKYDTVTPNMASKVAKWQGSTFGFTKDTRYNWNGATAIRKSVMFAYCTHNW